MLKTLRSRAWTRGGLVGLLTFGILALVPVAPAAAIQTISWITSPPATATVGQSISFAASGTANTFLGARITGCFVNFPDGNNYTNSYGGNYTTGTCSYTNRLMPSPGTYPITIGFTMSTGSTMSMPWNVSVVAPTPTVTVPSSATAVATSIQGAPVTFAASASDSYYGSYDPTCTPASGSVFGMGTTTVSCSATNLGGKTGNASFPVVVTKATPTIAWSVPLPVTYGTTYGDLETAAMQATDATGQIEYTRADGASFVSTEPIPVGTGQVLRATYTPSGAAAQAYNQVTVDRAVTVVKAASAVAFGNDTPTDKQYGDTSFPVTAAGTPGGGVVTITAQSGSTCAVSSPVTGTSATAMVAITGAGSCVLLADQAGTGSYNAAPNAQWSVTVAKANSQLTWTPPSSIAYGSPVSTLLDAAADVPGTFAYLIDRTTVPPATVLDAGTGHVVSVVFTPNQASNYAGATDSRTFDVLAAPQTVTVGAIADPTYGDAPVALTVGGTGPGAVSASATGACTVDGLDVTLVSAGPCSVTVSKAGTSNFLAADPVTRTFEVAKAAQTLTVDAIADQTYGADPVDLLVGGTGPGAVSASASGACTIDGLAVTLVAAGPCSVTVSKAGTSDFLTADPVTRTFDVLVAPQTLTVAPVADQTYGDAPVALTVGGTGPGAVSVSASPAEVCTVEGLDVTLVGAGDCSVTVTRAATSNFAAASVTRSFTVAPATAQLTWAVLSALTYGVPISAAQLNASVVGGPQSGGAFTYTLANGSAALGQVLPAGDHDLTATWTPVDAGWRTVSKTVTLHVDRVAPVLTWAAPDSVVSGTALGDDQLDAAADRPGLLSYTVDSGSAPARGQVLAPGSHVLHVSFAPTDSDNVAPASAQVSFTVRAVPTVVSKAAPVSRTLTVSRKGLTTASVSCSGGTTRCTGTVQLVALRTQRIAGKNVRSGTVLAVGTYTLRPGTTGNVALRPSTLGKLVLPSASLRQAQLRIGRVARTVSLRH